MEEAQLDRTKASLKNGQRGQYKNKSQDERTAMLFSKLFKDCSDSFRIKPSRPRVDLTKRTIRITVKDHNRNDNGRDCRVNQEFKRTTTGKVRIYKNSNPTKIRIKPSFAETHHGIIVQRRIGCYFGYWMTI
jgi:hypothetical protein